MMGMCENFLTTICTLVHGVFLHVQSEKYMTLTFQLVSTPMQHEHTDTFQVEGHILDHYCAWWHKVLRYGEWDSILICICSAALQLVGFGSDCCAVFPFLCIVEPGQEKQLLFLSFCLPLWLLMLAVLWSTWTVTPQKTLKINSLHWELQKNYPGNKSLKLRI